MVLTSYGSTDVDELKRTYSCFPSGVTALCALRDGVPIGMSAAKGVDRFANVDWEHSDSGAVFISGSSAWLECDIARIVEAGDHHLVLLTILAQSSSPDTEPLVFHRSRFRRLLAA